MNAAERASVAGYVAKEAYNGMGTVIYNGVKFPPYVHTEIIYAPVESQDKRSVEGMQVRVKVSGIVLPDMFYSSGGSANLLPEASQPGVDLFQVANPDLDLKAIRLKLSQRGKLLQIIGKGYGRIIIGSSKTAPSLEGNLGDDYYLDIDNGPKPGELKLNQYGPRAVRLEWECVATFIPCENLKTLPVNQSLVPKILSMAYSTDIAVQENLTVHRTIRGVVKLPSYLGKTDDRTDMPVRSYLYRDVFPKLDQFKRRTAWSLSEDRTLLSFNIVDEEIASDNPYPRGFASRCGCGRACSQPSKLWHRVCIPQARLSWWG